jgi:hypothetical protein
MGARLRRPVALLRISRDSCRRSAGGRIRSPSRATCGNLPSRGSRIGAPTKPRELSTVLYVLDGCDGPPAWYRGLEGSSSSERFPSAPALSRGPRCLAGANRNLHCNDDRERRPVWVSRRSQLGPIHGRRPATVKGNSQADWRLGCDELDAYRKHCGSNRVTVSRSLRGNRWSDRSALTLPLEAETAVKLYADKGVS